MIQAALRYKTILPRIGALLVDILVFALISVAMDGAELFLGNGAMNDSWLLSGLYLLYNIVGTARYGQTVGKWVAKVRVEAVDAPGVIGIGFKRAIKRELLWIISWVVGIPVLLQNIPVLVIVDWMELPVALIDIIIALSSPVNRALHDLIGETTVANLRHPLPDDSFDFEKPGSSLF